MPHRVFYEALRLFPPVCNKSPDSKYNAEQLQVIGIPKWVPEEESITLNEPFRGQNKLRIPAGSYMNLSVVGMHYNPRYWAEPEEFRPERFLAPDWPRDAFMPFSAGPRACIGKK